MGRRHAFVANLPELSRLPPNPSNLRTGLLLLLAEERGESHTRHLHHLETHTGDIADGVALTAEAGDENLVVLVDKVEATVAGHEGGDLLAVLDELNAHALTDGGVGLLGLNTELLEDDALGVGAAGEGLLPLGTEVRLVEVLVRPALLAAQVAQLTTGSKTTSLTVESQGEDRREAEGQRSVAGRCGRVDPTLGGSGYFLENTRTLKRKSRANGRRGDAAAGASTRERRSSMAGRGVRIEKSRPRASRALVVVPNRPRDASSGHPDPRWRAAPDPAPSGEPVNRASRRVRARGSGVTALLRA